MPGPNDNFISRTPITAIGASTNVGANVRITAQIETLSSGDRTTIERELAARPVPVQNFATTFAEVRKQGVAKAAAFSVAFADTLQTNDQIGQYFEDVALAQPADRVAILDAHKAAGFAEAVVHGVGLVPAAHGRVIMRDFLLRSGQVDPQAMSAVMDWLALAGKSIRERGIQIPAADAPHDGLFDDVVDWFEDAAGAVVDATKAVVDAVVNVAGGIVEGLKQIANWAADKVRDLVNGLLAAGQSLAQIVSDALQASFDALKKILQGIVDAGRTLVNVFQAIVNFTVQQIGNVVNALLAIGHTLVTVF